jgi:glycosyltransferase involved in cell wall biosynthesis
MNILWLTWKDYNHPEAGGAEVVAHELTSRLARDGHDVTLLTCGYGNAPAQEQLADGIKVIRIGKSRYTHSFQALTYYLRHLRGKFDILIEEVNGGTPYFSVLFERKAHRFMLYHQLARKNWFYETPAPLSYFGYYFLVPAASRLASLARTPVITVSESTRHMLANHGFHASRTRIISEGIELEPLDNLHTVKKYARPTLLSLGAMRAMKRTLDQVKAFELAKRRNPDLQLKLAGSASGAYGKAVLDTIEQSPFAHDIEYLGKVSHTDKLALMQKSHLILQTAVEEGWGLTITEAASQGTPAVAYDVDGLRDSIRNGKTGLVTATNPVALSAGIVQLVDNPVLYDRLRGAAWRWSQQITFDRSYRDFKKAVGLV